MSISAIIILIAIIIGVIYFRAPISKAATIANDEMEAQRIISEKKLHKARIELEEWLKAQDRKPLTLDELNILFNLHSPPKGKKNSYEEVYSKLHNNRKITIPSKIIYKPDELKKEIYSVIESAERFIYIAIYDINDYAFLDKLIEKSNNGIEIKILVDSKRMDEIYTIYTKNTINKIIDCFSQKNIHVKKWGSKAKGTMHKKEIIVDNKKLLLGSANFTQRGMNNNEEGIISISDLSMVQSATTRFVDLFYSEVTEPFDKILTLE